MTQPGGIPLFPHAAGCGPGRSICASRKLAGSVEDEPGELIAEGMPCGAEPWFGIGVETVATAEGVAAGPCDSGVAAASPANDPRSSAASTRTARGSCHPLRAWFRRGSTEYSWARGADKPHLRSGQSGGCSGPRRPDEISSLQPRSTASEYWASTRLLRTYAGRPQRLTGPARPTPLPRPREMITPFS